MQFFTPELLKLARSADQSIASTAADQWDQAGDEYRRFLRELRKEMPFKARKSSRHLNLHDGRVVEAASFEDLPLLSIVVRMPGSAGEAGMLLQLQYQTLGPHGHSNFTTQKFDIADDSEHPRCILYHEFARGEEPGTFTHSLLMSSGHVATIRFRDFLVRRMGKSRRPDRKETDELVAALM
jgi:hypothetical protein